MSNCRGQTTTASLPQHQRSPAAPLHPHRPPATNPRRRTRSFEQLHAEASNAKHRTPASAGERDATTTISIASARRPSRGRCLVASDRPTSRRLRLGQGSGFTTYGVQEHVTGNGRFATTHTFGAGLPIVHQRFWFQTASLPMGDYPWAPSDSRNVNVIVGGHPSSSPLLPLRLVSNMSRSFEP